MRRVQPLAGPVARAARRLIELEKSVALLDRVRPLNLAEERARLLAELEVGRLSQPVFVYAPGAALGAVRRELDELGAVLACGDVESRLLAERAAELGQEAELAERVGDRGFAQLAAQRFPLPDQPDEAARRARQFLRAPPAAHPQKNPEMGHDSADRRDPESLWSLVVRRLERERLKVRVELVPGLVSLAAVADGIVRIRPDARLSASVARRIALHEVEGHVRPRLLGQALGGVFGAGSARASEDEEGRAILLEERAGLLDVERRRELGQRYLAAAAVRGGAGFGDTVRLLGEVGATAEAALELACRVHRGGGLARESIYLTGYLRVAAELAAEPLLERVQECGRVSLAGARALLGAGSFETLETSG